MPSAPKLYDASAVAMGLHAAEFRVTNADVLSRREIGVLTLSHFHKVIVGCFRAVPTLSDPSNWRRCTAAKRVFGRLSRSCQTITQLIRDDSKEAFISAADPGPLSCEARLPDV